MILKLTFLLCLYSGGGCGGGGCGCGGGGGVGDEQIQFVVVIFAAILRSEISFDAGAVDVSKLHAIFHRWSVRFSRQILFIICRYADDTDVVVRWQYDRL